MGPNNSGENNLQYGQHVSTQFLLMDVARAVPGFLDKNTIHVDIDIYIYIYI